MLAAAKRCGLGDTEAAKTFASGFAKGVAEPAEEPPEKPKPNNGNGARDNAPWADGSPVEPKGDFAKEDYFAGSIEALSESLLASIGRRKNKVDRPIPTPFRDYNIALDGGFWPGLHSIVGGTGSWKTELATSTCSQCIDDGTPTVYVSLELEKEQVLCRIAAFRIGISWSRIWLGRYTDNELERIKAELEKMKGKPFRVEEGAAGEWCSDSLKAVTAKARESFPAGPLFVVLDFLQLVGANEGERVELREKIGKMSSVSKQLARKHGASVLLISSTARDKYSLLCSALKEAGLSTSPAAHGGTTKTIMNPDVLVGLGKEAGEIEYSVDSLTVIAKWPERIEGDRLLVLAVAKKRYGPPSWTALVAQGGTRLCEFPCDSIADLPIIEQKGGKVEVSEDTYIQRVIETVRLNPGKLKSVNDIKKCTKGDNGAIGDAIKEALRDGLLTNLADGTFCVGEDHL